MHWRSIVNTRLLITTLFAGLLISAQSQAGPRVTSGLHASSATGMSWFMVAFELGPWDEYLLHELTPDLERLTEQRVPRVSWMQFDDTLIIPDFAASLYQPHGSPVVFSLLKRSVTMPMMDGSAGQGGEGLRFEQSLLLPGVTRQVSDRSALTVSAVLASQRFGTSGMNLQEIHDSHEAGSDLGRSGFAQSEITHGAGVRLGLSTALLSNLSFEAAYQSRIEMAEFASLQGVHGSRAELDIPSRIHVGMELHVTPRTSINAGVSQIFYSEVGAFPSRSLPARFNALLGDSTSPQFDWEDLVVYSVGWRWQSDADLSMYFDYRTRSQPRPSAPSLAAALGPELAQNAFMAGLNKGLGSRSSLHFSAAYAPPEFAFGGNVLGIVTDKLDQGIELQATFNLNF